jgi:hypothetical protein
MAKKLGKVVKDVTGYKIRQMIESKSVDIPTKSGTPKKETRTMHTGKYGVYAGKKKLVKDGFKSVTEATEYVNNEIMTKK